MNLVKFCRSVIRIGWKNARRRFETLGGLCRVAADCVLGKEGTVTVAECTASGTAGISSSQEISYTRRYSYLLL